MKKIDRLVEEVLKQRQRTAYFFAEQNLNIARKNEDFLALEKQEVEEMINLANLRAESNCNFPEIEEKIKEIKNKKVEILNKIGFKEEDVLPKFHCKNCNDTGKNNCKCKTEIKNKILLKKAGIEGELESFENAKSVSKETDKALEILKKFAEKFPNVAKKNIFISGETGVGKTYMTSCLANELIKKGVYIYITTAFNLNNIFVQYCKARDEEKQSILGPLIESEVLFIDDLGTEPILNNITLNYLYLVLNERTVGNKSTIINSNLGPDGIIDRYGERIFSRIFNQRIGLAIKLEGEDLRIKK